MFSFSKALDVTSKESSCCRDGVCRRPHDIRQATCQETALDVEGLPRSVVWAIGVSRTPKVAVYCESDEMLVGTSATRTMMTCTFTVATVQRLGCGAPGRASPQADEAASPKPGASRCRCPRRSRPVPAGTRPLTSPRSLLRHPSACRRSRTTPLAQCQRGGILHVSPADLDDVPTRLRLRLDRMAQRGHRRKQTLATTIAAWRLRLTP